MKLIQNLIYQIKEIIDVGFGVTDETGLILGCSEEGMIGTVHKGASEFAKAKELSAAYNGISYKKVAYKNKIEFIVYIDSVDNTSQKFMSLIALNLSNIKNYYEEKVDKGNFLRDIVLERISPGDIALRANELHLKASIYRVVMVVRIKDSSDAYVNYVTLNQMLPNKSKDQVLLIDDRHAAIVIEMKSAEDMAEITKFAKSIINTLNTELMVKAQIGIGSIVGNVSEIARSYNEAKTAIMVSDIFENDKGITDYSRLGIGRLISMLPAPICRLFLKEVFGEEAFELIDSETLITVQKFFENNLNVSETSRQLYVHRNTLVYRLDKIQKITGLDLRNFDDAITFKVSLLVKRYLEKAKNFE